MKLRHMPLFLVRELLRYHTGRQVGDLIERVIQRPDEMAELLAVSTHESSQARLLQSEPARAR